MTMQELNYTVSFNTPAFLGNAKQSGQWRTPPFKALLRQWWRVVKAPQLEHPFSVDELRVAEAELFGTASDDEETRSHRSRVRLRLKHWNAGNLGNETWPKQEMRNIQVGQGNVRADVYLGFGPIVPPSKKQGRPEPKLERRAIEPNKHSNEFSIRFDEQVSNGQIEEVRAALRLASWFGGVGSRSRNGWGAVMLEGDGIPRVPGSVENIAPYCQNLEACFAHDWPHAIGADDAGALVWIGRENGQAFKNWREAICFLATVRRDIRSEAKRFGRNEAISANQLIAYPVTKADNNRWGNDERIASSLRFKIVDTGDGVAPLVVHLPCALPKVLYERLSNADQRWVSDNQIKIWTAVHKKLDQLLTRLGEGQ